MGYGSHGRWCMRWVSAVSVESRVEAAVDQAAAAVEAGLDGAPPDLLLVFATPLYRAGLGELPGRLRRRLGARTLVGMTGRGVLGVGQEVEEGCALGLVAATLPGVEVTTFALRVGEGVPDAAAWQARLGLDPHADPALLLCADPFTSDVGNLLDGLDAALPGAVKVGGLASGGESPGRHATFHQDRTEAGGAVGVALVGDVEARAVVGQGARPVGPVMRVTAARRNLALGLDGRSAMARLAEVLPELGAAERAALQRAPLVGIAVDGARARLRPGDFLVRNVVGVDRDQGALALGALCAEGDRVQLHVRDAAAATAELDALLEGEAAERPGAPAGAVIFACVGRGRRFFGEAGHDVGRLAARRPGVPAGGAFCGGEIGPVHRRTWLHTYTASMALFRPRTWD